MQAVVLNDYSQKELIHTARTTGIRYRTGPFSIRLTSDIPELVELVSSFYGQCPSLPQQAFCQYHVNLMRSKGLRRWIRPKALFNIDGISPFEPYPLDHALPLYEWGLNWCLGTTANHYLLLHSAVVERNGFALIMPALPGSGKSTLCSALIHRGWRLLSDEFGVVRHSDGAIIPLPRAIPLKNESIEVIKQFAPDAKLGPLCHNTRKGDVRHLAPPADSVTRQETLATPKWIIFPKYTLEGSGELEPQSKDVVFTRLSNNSFNYQICLENGFNSLARLVNSTTCYQFRYRDLARAVDTLTDLADREAV